MSLTPAEGQRLDALAVAALDALRDQDRAAVDAATRHPDANLERLRAQHSRAVQRAQDAELALFDAIHALVTHRPEKAPSGPRRAWLTQ